MQRKQRPLPVIKQKGDIVNFNYKDPEALLKYVSERGRIFPRGRSGLTAKEQKQLAVAVKRARMLALMAFAA